MTEPTKRRFSRTRLMAACLLSMWAGFNVWSRPSAPTWVSETVTGGSKPLGFTPEGMLVSLDSSDNVAAPSMLRVREAATGKIVQEHLLGIPLNYFGELTPDGESVILQLPMTGAKDQMLVISRKTGQRRYPPIRDTSVTWLPQMPDSRYRVMAVGIPGDTTGKSASIFDLTTGKFLYPTDDRAVFSPDGQQWVSLDQDGRSPWLVFRSLADGHEIGRTLAPEFPAAQGILLAGWTHDRLELAARFDLPLDGDETRNWSFRVDGTQLTDKRFEPAHTAQNLYYKSEYSWWVGGDDWAARASYETGDDNWFVHRWNRSIRRLPGRDRLQIKGFYRWQLVSPTTGEPNAREIQVIENWYDIPFVASRDGRWLVEAGKQLRVWRLPPPPQSKQLPGALLAAAAPWGLLFLRWRRRTHHPAHAGRSPGDFS